MASRWYLQVEGGEVGPLTFQELAELIRAGKLTEQDRVRRESSGDWIRADEVIGLFHVARQQEPIVPSDASPSTPEDSAPPSAASISHPNVPRARLLEPVDYWIILAVAIILLVINLYFWWPESPGKFPAPRLWKRPPVDASHTSTPGK